MFAERIAEWKPGIRPDSDRRRPRSRRREADRHACVQGCRRQHLRDHLQGMVSKEQAEGPRADHARQDPRAARHGLSDDRRSPDLAHHPQEVLAVLKVEARSEEHTSELQLLMRISYAVFCLNTLNKIVFTI